MFFCLRRKNLNAKIKEINVLLNFSQMFNMQALGYTAGIEAVFHIPFLAKLEQAYRDRWLLKTQLLESTDHPLTLEEEERKSSLLHTPREKSHMELGLEI